MTLASSSNGSMKILSAVTGVEWVTCIAPEGSGDPARIEAENHRQKLDQLLTEVLLSENVVILAGLGTTLCLNKPTGPKVAPGMSDLWDAADQKAGSKFEDLKTTVGYTSPPDGDNIEVLLSQCQLSEGLKPAREVRDFIADTEAIIVEKCRFVDEGTDLTIHDHSCGRWRGGLRGTFAPSYSRLIMICASRRLRATPDLLSLTASRILSPRSSTAATSRMTSFAEIRTVKYQITFLTYSTCTRSMGRWTGNSVIRKS